MNTAENNKKIAAYVGGEHANYTHDEDMPISYHNSWEWLMPAVEKVMHEEIECSSVEVEYELEEIKSQLWDAVSNFDKEDANLQLIEYINLKDKDNEQRD